MPEDNDTIDIQNILQTAMSMGETRAYLDIMETALLYAGKVQGTTRDAYLEVAAFCKQNIRSRNA